MEHERDFNFISYEISGGYEDAERVIVRFGSEDELGYEEAYPITLLRIAPLQSKFADDLTHRDFLGSLMNLGIERDVLGDLLINEKCAYLFCKESVADYIIDIGPDGGDKGGTIVATGTPEEVAKNEKSYTGQYLRKVL